MFGIGCSDHLTVQDGPWTGVSPAKHSASTHLAPNTAQPTAWGAVARRTLRTPLGTGLRWEAIATVLAAVVVARGLAEVSELLSIPDWLV